MVGGFGRGRNLGRVERRTPAGRLVVRLEWGVFLTFNPDGTQRGADEWRPLFLQPLTDAQRQEIQDERERSQLLGRLPRVRWGDLPTETLQEVLRLVDAAVPD